MNRKRKSAIVLLAGMIIGNLYCNPVNVHANNFSLFDNEKNDINQRENNTIEGINEIVDEKSTEENEEQPEKSEFEEKCKVDVVFDKYNCKNKTCNIKWKAEWEDGDDQVNNEIEKKIYYKIYRGLNDKWKMIEETENKEVKLEIPACGKEYSYKVEAYIKEADKAEGEEEINEQEKCVGRSTNLTVCFPKSMTKIITTATSSSKVKLSWNKVKGATQYIVYKKNSNGKFKKIAQTSKASIKLEVAKNKKYDYKIIPIYQKNKIEIAAKEKEVTFNNSEFVSLSHQKYTYKEMEADIKALSKKYGEYISYESIGKSEQGREIYDVVLGNPEAKNSVMVVSTLHAREYAATVTLMKQLEYYLMNYNRKIDGVVPSKIFDKCCIHYLMMANPDGVMLSQNGDSLRKTNAKGVNLNNDFPNSKKEGHEKRAAETKAIIKHTNNLKENYKLYVVNYHAMGQIVFGSYGGKNTRVKKDITKMYKIARSTTGYADSGGYSSSTDFSRTGGYRDYLSYILGIPSITIEVGSVPCPVPQWEYNSIFNKNKLVILREADYAVKTAK